MGMYCEYSGENWVNSLAPGGFDYSLKLVNFKLISRINILGIFCEIAIRRMPLYLTDHYSTWTSVDPDLRHHMASLGTSELNQNHAAVI